MSAIPETPDPCEESIEAGDQSWIDGREPMDADTRFVDEIGRQIVGDVQDTHSGDDE